MAESVVEEAALGWLEGLGYTTLHGTDIAVGMPGTEAHWIANLDDFLRLGEREILEHAGRVSHDVAVARAESEYERFSEHRATLPSPVEWDFHESVRAVKQIESRRAPRAKRSRKA